VLFGRDYWRGLADWLEERVAGEGKISPEDLKLFLVTDEPKEALGWIIEARERRTRAFRAMNASAQATR
jgi:predicted Rossmann-fold nucleotide-binding protein